jgi:hypothetical protein
MAIENETLRRLAAAMRKSSFDLAADGTLIFRDPMIGRLEHQRRQLAVRLDRNGTHLDLIAHGQIMETFSLEGEIAQACESAFGAYFTAFECECSRRHEQVAAAA